MPYLISPEAMRECERAYFEKSGVKSIDMMEEAARALTNAVFRYYPDAKRVFIACGSGGNGGDGYACARMLHERGLECTIYAPSPAKSPDAVENARRAAGCGIKILEGILPDDDEEPDLWIDCLFGTGLSRAPEGMDAELIDSINRHHSFGSGVISADIPSGLNGRTGKSSLSCVRADYTIAFGLEKYGHYLQDGLDVCGKIQAQSLSFPSDIYPKDLPQIVNIKFPCRLVLRRRHRNIHKNTCGHLLIIAGSVGMAGAAALCARAALRSGAGLVTIACPEEIVPILQMQAPCAMCLPLPQENGAISAAALPLIEEALNGKNAVVIGPGLSRNASPEVLRAVLESGVPAVIDADALNLISANPGLKKLLNNSHVLTPHPGEAKRLHAALWQDDPIADAQAIAGKTGASVVLKGASRVIVSGGRTTISTSGASGMARGGSGDVFAGLLGGMMAWRSISSYLIHIACEIHGLAGEAAQEKYGGFAVNAADIIEFIPEVFKRYEP